MAEGMMPNLTSEVANTAPSPAIQMSQAEARPMPPPNAAPCTRAMVGLFISASVRNMPASLRASAMFSSTDASAARRIQLRSAPAEKLLPRPASTTTRTAASSSSWRQARVSSAMSCSLKALCTSGRFIQSVATLPSRAISRVSYMPAPYIRNKPNLVGWIGALRLADRDSPRMRRVCAGSTTPSSHRRAVA